MAIRNHPSKQLPIWRPRQPVDHRKLNETNQAIESLLAAPARPQRLFGARATQIAQFKISTIQGDFLECVLSDGVIDGEEAIAVARPYLLRTSLLAHNSVTFSYTTFTSRTADDGSSQEAQVIVPAYVVGDYIYAAYVLNGTPVNWAPETGRETLDVAWIDINVDGRAWAKTAGV